MPNKSQIDLNRYGYVSGRIRALEAQLMDGSKMNRLFDARSPEEISRVMQESGYPAESPELALDLETANTYELISQLMPDREFVEALLIFNDCHNLKVIEKYLATWWPKQRENLEDVYETEAYTRQENRTDFIAPELPTVNASVAFTSIESQMHKPCLIAPEKLFRSIRDRQPELIPAWLYQAAIEAASAVQARYDVSEIDQILDRVAFREAINRAEHLGNRFFLNYLHLRADVTNIDVLLRARALKAGKRLFEQTLLPAGRLNREKLLESYDAEPEAVTEFLAGTRFSALVPFVQPAGQRNSATQFGKAADHLILDHLQLARFILRGPEIPVAYLIARLMEIKNIRIAQTLLRNRIPAAKGREMMRDSYFGRR
ncbi:MAG: V-type ATPase subunit [Eubacteriales bacterium]|nr:V-type ATPase subunit [Eubacteriales bacterium]